MRSRVLLVSFLLLFVAVSSLAAWPTSAAKKAEEPIQALAEVLAQAEVVEPLMPSTDSSQSSAQEFLSQLKDVQTQVNDNRKVSNETKAEMNDLIEKLQAYFALEEVEDAIAAETLAKLDEVLLEKEETNKRLDRVEKLLEKEKGTKPFVSAEMALGFHEGLPVFGISGQAGVRLGGSLTASIGGTYMFGSFGNAVWEKNLDRMQVTGLIGWEF